MKSNSVPKKSLFFITGASRGLGESLAQLALQEGHTVIGISRSRSSFEHPNFKQHQVDLTNAKELAQVESVFKAHTTEDFQKVHLVNNSGMIFPVGDVGTLSADEITNGVQINFTSAVLLSNLFLKIFKSHTAEQVITVVTSGVAKYPKATWSVYSAAKAGLNAFAIALSEELKKDSKYQVICFEPGIIDTQMQAEIRAIPASQFPDVDRFKDFKTSGALASPLKVATKLYQIFQSENSKNKLYHSISD